MVKYQDFNNNKYVKYSLITLNEIHRSLVQLKEAVGDC